MTDYPISSSLMPWLIRFAHVLAAAVWVGGYAMLAIILPAPLPPRISRLLTLAGTTTIAFGLLLVGQTRGFPNLGRGEWGHIVLATLGLAVAMMGIGDAALRPALAHSSPSARRWAMLALTLGILAIAFMTRTVQAGS